MRKNNVNNTFAINRYKLLRTNNSTVRDLSISKWILQSDLFLSIFTRYRVQEYHWPLRRKAKGAVTGSWEKNGGKKEDRGENDGAERSESLKQLEEKSAVFFVRWGERWPPPRPWRCNGGRFLEVRRTQAQAPVHTL